MVVDIDPEYSLDEPSPDELAVNDELRAAPWYHVVMEDDDGQPKVQHTYLSGRGAQLLEKQKCGDGKNGIDGRTGACRIRKRLQGAACS